MKIASPLLALGAGVCLYVSGLAAQEVPQRPVKDLGQADAQIHWPVGFTPQEADVFVHNEIAIHAPAAAIWENLVDALQWPAWYANSADVQVLEPPGQTKLAAGSRFAWKTFNQPVESTVDQFVPGKVLAWYGRGKTAQGYHVWLMVEQADGNCLVITEETQKGPGAIKRGVEQPRAQYDAHDWWLSALKVRSERAAGPPPAHELPGPTQGDYVIKDFRFASGQLLQELKLHYHTLGTPQRDAQGHVQNAVLIMHGTAGSGAQFMNLAFAGELFGPGQPLDVTKFFVILPDDIGHGQSSRPSEGQHARFPNYRYADMVEAEHRLIVDGLHVDHLRLVMGTSMGGMHTWMWGEQYPDMMDALMPLASLPAPIGGRNRVWRRMVSEAIRGDKEWANGDYQTQPPSMRTALGMFFFVSDNPKRRSDTYPTGEAADKALDEFTDKAIKQDDANDFLYAIESSADYDPSKNLEAIRALLVAVNSVDDLINPPDQGIMEREIVRVPRGRAVLIPEGPDTRGHGTHTVAKVWKADLEQLLQASASK